MLVKSVCFVGAPLPSREPDATTEDPEPGPSSQCNTPKKQKMRKEIARLRTKLSRLKKQKNSSPRLTTQDKRIKHIMSQLSCYLPNDTLAFIETQIRMSRRSKQGKRWSITSGVINFLPQP